MFKLDISCYGSVIVSSWIAKTQMRCIWKMYMIRCKRKPTNEQRPQYKYKNQIYHTRRHNNCLINNDNSFSVCFELRLFDTFRTSFCICNHIYSAWSSASIYMMVLYLFNMAEGKISRLHCRWEWRRKNICTFCFVVGKYGCLSQLNPIKKYHDLWNEIVNLTLGTAFCWVSMSHGASDVITK